MGEAFDRACKSPRNLGSAVPEIIAYLIIQAAKTGESFGLRRQRRTLDPVGDATAIAAQLAGE
jgi:hypothetical protein